MDHEINKMFYNKGKMQKFFYFFQMGCDWNISKKNRILL